MTTITDQFLSGGVTVSQTPDDAGRTAALRAGNAISEAIEEKGEARVIFASAPSQEATIQALRRDVRIDWARVQAFHMDEYLGLRMDAPQAFGQWLATRLPSQTRLERFDTTADPTEEAERYASLLLQAPVDLTCLGIGVNGHIAFNEPNDTDFEDPELVRVVELDDISRKQQVDEGLFPHLDDVPTNALTLTVPALLGASAMVATVLGHAKAQAVTRALRGPISPECPFSVLRTHGAASMHLDLGAAAELDPGAADPAGAVQWRRDQ